MKDPESQSLSLLCCRALTPRLQGASERCSPSDRTARATAKAWRLPESPFAQASAYSSLECRSQSPCWWWASAHAVMCSRS